MALDRVVDINQVMSGSEPNFANVTIQPTQLEHVLMSALNWYSREKTWDDSVKYFISHFKGDKQISPNIANKTIANVGYLTRMVSRGYPLTDKIKTLIDETYKKSVIASNELRIQEKKKAEEAKKEEKLVYVVPGLITDSKVGDYLNQFDEHIDNIIMGVTKSVNLHSTTFSKSQKDQTKKYINNHLKGIDGLTSEELGFSGKTERIIREFIAKILNELGSLPERAPRKKKVVPIEKQVEKLQVSKKSEIKKEKIIGANILVAYDEKSRKIRIYHSTDGFGVKGTTITNVDEDKSFGKTLRKPDEQLVKIKSLARVSLLKEVEAIRATESKVNGRFNEQIILLKVF